MIDNNVFETIDSHVQLPKSVLKHFANEHGGLYYYDCKRGLIGKSGAGKLNVITGYYSKPVDATLGVFEREFGSIIKILDEVDYENPNLLLSSEEEDIIKNYARALLARSPKQHKEIADGTVFISELTEQVQHGVLALGSIEYMINEGLFDNMIITIMLNKTDIPFVIPMIGMYELCIEDNGVVVIPVTRNKAILFFPKELEELVILPAGKTLYHLMDEEKVKELNRLAFRSEVSFNGVAIASGCKGILEQLVYEY